MLPLPGNSVSVRSRSTAEQLETADQVKSAVFAYIEVFYNRLRRHSTLGCVSPAEFEKDVALAA